VHVVAEFRRLRHAQSCTTLQQSVEVSDHLYESTAIRVTCEMQDTAIRIVCEMQDTDNDIRPYTARAVLETYQQS